MGWKDVLSKVAPALSKALALTGPVGAAASALLESTLGVRSDALEAKLTNLTADDIVKLRDADRAFARDMEALRIEGFKAEAGDRADARKREVDTHDWVVKVLALGIVALFMAVCVFMWTSEVPAANRDAANQVLGILYGAVMLVLGYYFGSSMGSRAKDATIEGLSK